VQRRKDEAKDQHCGSISNGTLTCTVTSHIVVSPDGGARTILAGPEFSTKPSMIGGAGRICLIWVTFSTRLFIMLTPQKIMFFAYRAHTVYQTSLYDNANCCIVIAIV